MAIKRKAKTKFHVVRLRITKQGRLVCAPEKVTVNRREKIIWRWSGVKDFPFGLVLKSPFTPLGKHFYITSLKPGIEKKIEARVLNCVPAGYYPYLVVAYVDNKVVIEDPEIIVRPPAGG